MNLNLQKPFRYESKPSEITPVMMDKESADLTITKEVKETVTEVAQVDNFADEEESSSNELDNVPCSVKTKPYYSINAKLNQRERKPSIFGKQHQSQV